MKYKTSVLTTRFVDLLSRWPGVECISLNEAAGVSTLDPYFALILDVYHSGTIPSAEERFRLYGPDAAVFENSRYSDKDRFLIGDIPLRFEFKSVKKIDELVFIADTKRESLWLVKDSGTYGYYRLVNGEILFSRSGWIDKIRKRLASLDDDFWNQMRELCRSKMEHLLSDLGAALINNDAFHYLVSSALFIKTACLVLFCINHCFEPSHRGYSKKVLELPVLPESYKAQFETFIQGDAELTMERKYGLAQLIAKGIVGLCVTR
ncbi:MAG: DUF4037 domain-containing protein [Treponema sp.]|jgi:hypothetical protein|nr:DUF4037 domain-containing protein [Treponema sp.]